MKREREAQEKDLFDKRKVAQENAAKEAALKEWEANGKKYTAITTTDKQGTHTIYVKVGVPSESNFSIMGPDGRKYEPWDPKLNQLLVAGGFTDDRGNAQGFTNDKAMKNEMALKRDEQLGKKAAERIARGDKNVAIPGPTGHRNNDAWGVNKAPTVNDHRTKTTTSSTSSTLNTPPAAGTASTAVTNPAAMGGVRDHRPGGNAANTSGGVTLTQTAPKIGTGGSIAAPSSGGTATRIKLQ